MDGGVNAFPVLTIRAWSLLFLLALAACTQLGESATPEATPITPSAFNPTLAAPTPVEPGLDLPLDLAPQIPESIPPPDTSRHRVPLDRIYFDTFQPVNRSVPLSSASPELIERLLDAIPPIHDPRFVSAAESDWLESDSMVLGYATAEGAWAFPVRILNFHEIVNTVIGGEPILVSYCPLCYSGIVYSRRMAGGVLTFGNTSALYESDMVMVDYQTGSYWWQVAGSAIVGPLTGSQLTVLPGVMSSWGAWRNLYPDTLVMSRDTGYDRNYDRDPFSSYAEFINGGTWAFPVSQAARDPRLRPADIVAAIRVGDTVRGYPIAGEVPVVFNDTIEGQPVLVVGVPADGFAAAYSPVVDALRLEFRFENGGIADRQTGSTWTITGKATSGPMSGQMLQPLAMKTTYWFAIAAAEPEITLAVPDSGSTR